MPSVHYLMVIFPGYYGITCFVTGYDTDKAVPVRTDNGMSIIESKLYATGTMRYITEIPMDGSGFQGMAIGGAVVINTGAITPTPNTGVISNITMPPLYDPGFILRYRMRPIQISFWDWFCFYEQQFNLYSCIADWFHNCVFG